MESNNLKSMPMIVLVVLLGACFCVQCGQGVCLRRVLAGLQAGGSSPNGPIVILHMKPRGRQVRAPVGNDDDMESVRADDGDAPTDTAATQAPTTDGGEKADPILDFLEQLYQTWEKQRAFMKKAETTHHSGNIMEMIECGIMSDPEPVRTTPPPTPPPNKCSDSAKPTGPNSDPVLCNGEVDSLMEQARAQIKEAEDARRAKLESEAEEERQREARIGLKLLRLNGT